MAEILDWKFICLLVLLAFVIVLLVHIYRRCYLLPVKYPPGTTSIWRKLFVLLIVLAAIMTAAFLVFGQPPDVTEAIVTSATIRDIQDHPHRYSGQWVRVNGKVGGRVSIAGCGGYILRDGEEAISVITNAPVPPKDELVTANGKVSVPLQSPLGDLILIDARTPR